MENSNISGRKLILFCVGAPLLVMAGMYRDCLPQPHPKLIITFTGTGTGDKIESAQTPAEGAPDGYLNKSNHDLLEWRNKSDTDLLVCMVDPDPGGRAFVSTFFYVPMGSSVMSGPVRHDATPSVVGTNEHKYTFVNDPPDNDQDNCARDPLTGHWRYPQKPISVQ